MTRSQGPPSGQSKISRGLYAVSGSTPNSSVQRARARHLAAEALFSAKQAMVGRTREVERLEELFRKTVYKRKASAIMVHGATGVGKHLLVQTVAGRLIGSGGRFRMLEARPLDWDLGFLASLMRSRFKEELESSMPAKALVTTLRMLVPTEEVVEVCFTVASLLGLELPTKHASLESMGELLRDPIRRRPFLVDILQRIFRREAERLPLLVVLSHPELADKESQAILSELVPSWQSLPILLVSLQKDATFTGAPKPRKNKFVPAYTGPGAATVTNFDITRMGKVDAPRSLEPPRPRKTLDLTSKGRTPEEEVTACEISASIATEIDGLSSDETDETLVLDAKRFYKAPKVFGLESELMGLRPLPDMQMESLVRGVLAPVVNLPDALVNMLLTRLEGIPGRLRQHITALVTHGVLEQSDDGGWAVVLERLQGDSMPSDLDSLSRARIEKLPAKHRRLLELAGVVGPLFRLRDVLTLMRLTGDRGEVPFFEKRTESRLRGVLLDLQGQEFIIYEPSLGPQGDEAFRFRFERERELLLQDVDEKSARFMHRVLAQVQERRGAKPEEIFRHWMDGGAKRRAYLAMLRAGVAYSRAFKAEKAIENLETALAELEMDEGEDTLKGMTALAESYMVQGDFTKVEDVCAALAQGAYALDMPIEGGRALYLQGSAARHIGDLDRAEKNLTLALDLVGGLEGDEALGLKAEILDEHSLNSWQQGAHFSKVLELSDQALAIREELGDVPNTARTLLNIAQIQYARQKFDEAQGCLKRAASLAESEDLRQVLAKAKNGLGILALTRGDHLAAQRLWAEVLDISQSLGDRGLRATVFGNLGELAYEKKNMRLANDLLNRSVDLARSIGEYRVSGESLRLLSMVVLDQGDLSKAVDVAKEALGEAQRSGMQSKIGLALGNLADLWRKTLTHPPSGSTYNLTPMAREEEAVRCYEQAISLFEEMGNSLDLKEILEGYRLFLEERGRTSAARSIVERLKEIQ